LLWLAQEDDGWVSSEAMREIGDILGISAAEVLGTASFYTMYKREPVGRYLVSVCRGISCMWLGAEELVAHLSESLGIGPGQTTADGLFTLEEMECAAACDGAPCVLVNYLYGERVSAEMADEMVADLRAGRHPWMLQDALPVGTHPGPAVS
jgi:NADH-quinone oxidoreductase subunit E